MADKKIRGNFPASEGMAQVDTIADLKALVETNVDSVTVLGYTTKGDNEARVARFDAGNTTADNGGTIFIPTYSGFGGTGRWIFDNNVVSVKDFGAKGDGTTDDAIAIGSAITYTANNAKELLFPAGTYNHSTTLKFAQVNNTVVRFENAIVNHTGTGNAIQFGRDDNSAVYFTRAYNVRVTGNDNTTNGVVVRAHHHAKFDSLNVRNVVTAGLRLLWCVENLFTNYVISSNEGAFTTVPLYGVRIGETVPGAFSVGCNFINATIEGVSSNGVWIDSGDLNSFIGGTSEGNGRGIFIDNTLKENFRNKFDSFWCEANTISDLQDFGTGTIITGCYFGSNTPSVSNLDARGSMLTFNGGWIRHALLDASSTNTRFNDVIFSDAASIGIKGPGSHTVKGCSEAGTNGLVTDILEDKLATTGTFTPTLEGATTAGSHTYTTQDGTFTRIGELIHFNINIVLSVKDGAMDGTVNIVGLPFISPTGRRQDVIVGLTANIAFPGSRTAMAAYVNPATFIIVLWSTGNDLPASQILSTGIASDSIIQVSGMYSLV